MSMSRIEQILHPSRGRSQVLASVPPPLIIQPMPDGIHIIFGSPRFTPGVQYRVILAPYDLGDFQSGMSNPMVPAQGSPYSSMPMGAPPFPPGLSRQHRCCCPVCGLWHKANR